MATLYFTVYRDDEPIDLEVDYEVSQIVKGISQSRDYPGEPSHGGEIEELEIYCPEDENFIATKKEIKAIEDRIYETHEYEYE